MKENLGFFCSKNQSSPEFCFEATKIRVPSFKSLKTRSVPKSPKTVLDAEYLRDDFYINVLDWSKDNLIAVGLTNSVYVWDYKSKKIIKLVEIEDDHYVSSIKWDQFSNKIAVGNSEGKLEIYDFNKGKTLLSTSLHNDRLGSISFHNNLLLTGSKLGRISFCDIRDRKSLIYIEDNYQEICGLEWSPDAEYFLAGTNNNKMLVYSLKMMNVPIMCKSHKAAVRALGWSKTQIGIFASGGGTADQTIKLWNVLDRKLVDSTETGSQICSLLFTNQNEIITAHGFSKNEINIWNPKNFNKISSFTGHTSRVLYMSLSPDS